MVIDIAPATAALQRNPSSDSAHNPGRSEDFDAAAGTRFEVAGSLALHCTIPIPNTGFELTKVKGSVVLFQGLTQVGVELDVATQLKINGTAPIAASGGAFLQAVPEFRLDLNAALYLFGKQAAQSTATIKSRSASFKLWVDYYVIRGQVALNAWSNETGFHFTGQGSLALILPKGLFVNEWWLTFPPKDLELANVDVAVGEFTNGAWGFRGKGCVWKFCTGFYVDTAGRLTFRDVDQYRLVTPPQLARAVAHWQASKEQGRLAGDFLEDGIVVRADGSALGLPGWVEKPTDVIFVLSKKQEYAPSMTLLAPGGAVITPTVTLSDTVAYSLTAVGGEFPYQEVYAIREAAAGAWEVLLDDLPEPGTYGVSMIGAKPGPRLTDVAAASLTPERAALTWKLNAAAPVTLTLHANPGPITTTVMVTTTVPPTTEVLDDFTGYLLHTDPAPIADGSAQTFDADLSELPGGAYHLWAMAEDGLNPPVRVYARDPVTITHAWSDTWQANLHAGPGFRQLDLSWDKHANPDIDFYLLNFSPAPYSETLAITVTNRITYTLESLSPGTSYRLWLDAVDASPALTRTARSEQISATTTIADFAVLQDSPAPIMVAGAVVTESLLLTSAAQPFPEAVNLYPGPLPPGFAMGFVPQVITPTIAGAPVSVVITASRTLTEGNYTLPILAIGAGAAHTLELPAMILAPDFSIAPQPSPVLLRRAGTAVIRVGTQALRGMTETIHLSLEGAPMGLAYRFEPADVSPGVSSSLVISDTTLLQPGEYLAHIRGVSLLGHRSAALPITVTATRAVYLPLLIRPAPLPCTDAAANGGFELNAAWTFPITGSTAGYTTSQAHSGTRSARFGLLPGMAAAAKQPDGPARIETNLLGETGALGATYSSGYQTVSIPSDATSATLHFWYKPGAQGTSSADFQRVLILRPGDYDLLKQLMRIRQNSTTWREASFDLIAYRGKSIVLYFETYNDSTGAEGRTWMYLDDVSLEVCR